MSNTYTFNYNDNEQILVSSNTVYNMPCPLFKPNGQIHEKESLNYFYSLINKNNNYNIIDVGANIGLYSLYAKHLPKSQFYSFEPIKFAYNILNDNIKLNNITNINTYNIGLSNKKGKEILNVCMSNEGLSTMGTNPLRFDISKDSISIEVEIDTIDNIFFNNNVKVDFIKIDTEGYEYFILKGAEQTIKKYKPIIQLEFNEINMKQCNITPKQLYNYITELEYKILNLTNEELIIVHNTYS